MTGRGNGSAVKTEPEESDPATRLREELDKSKKRARDAIRFAGQYLGDKEKLERDNEDLQKDKENLQKDKENLQKRVEFLESLIDQKNVDGPKLRESLEKRIEELTAELAQYKNGSQQASQDGEKIHFRIGHAGSTRRFTLSRTVDLLATVKDKVKQMTYSENRPLYWKDEESRNVLESDDDLSAAIEFAQSKNKEQPCVHLEADEEGVFRCDECRCVIVSAIVGRFQCMDCNNIDLCMDCLEKHPNHQLYWFMSDREEVVMARDVGDAMTEQQRNARKRSLREVQNAEDFTDEENGENDDDDDEDYTPGSSRKTASNKGSRAKRSTNSAGAMEPKGKSTKGDEAGPSKK